MAVQKMILLGQRSYNPPRASWLPQQLMSMFFGKGEDGELVEYAVTKLEVEISHTRKHVTILESRKDPDIECQQKHRSVRISRHRHHLARCRNPS